MHAWVESQSEFSTHSGRQPGGAPMYDTWHEQTARQSTSRHWLYGPHGDGLHGEQVSATTGDVVGLISGTTAMTRHPSNGLPL